MEVLFGHPLTLLYQPIDTETQLNTTYDLILLFSDSPQTFPIKSATSTKNSQIKMRFTFRIHSFKPFIAISIISQTSSMKHYVRIEHMLNGTSFRVYLPFSCASSTHNWPSIQNKILKCVDVSSFHAYNTFIFMDASIGPVRAPLHKLHCQKLSNLPTARCNARDSIKVRTRTRNALTIIRFHLHTCASQLLFIIIIFLLLFSVQKFMVFYSWKHWKRRDKKIGRWRRIERESTDGFVASSKMLNCVPHARLMWLTTLCGSCVVVATLAKPH